MVNINWSHYLIFIGIPFFFGMWAQWRVKSAFSKYAKVPTSGGRTGAQVAQQILNAVQIHDVEIAQIDGMLGDHYDPTRKRLCLSSDVYGTASIAAAGIAAHETGHAIQHARAYAPLKWRMTIVPMTQIASRALPIILLAGFFLPFLAPMRIVVVKLVILCYLALAIFQFITLPVEYDASRRAKIILQQMGLVTGGEVAGVNKMLNAAALTYVAAFVVSLGSLFYWLSVLQRRN